MSFDESCPRPDTWYHDRILDHYEEPYHRGRCPGCTHAYEERNLPCGEMIRMELRIDEQGIVRAIYFSGDGCAINQAAASMLAQHLEDKHVDFVRRFTAEDMIELFGVPLTPQQRNCCLLSWRVLRRALDSPRVGPEGQPGSAAGRGQTGDGLRD